MEDKDWLNGKTAQEIISYSKEIIELGKKKEQFEKEARVTCINNLKKIGGAFRIYCTDNKDLFPYQVYKKKGSYETETVLKDLQPDPDWFNDDDGRPVLVDTHLVFKAIAKHLDNTKLLVCPADKTATAAKDIDSITERNVSYKFGLSADESKPNRIMCLCKHHATWVPPKSKIVDTVGKVWHVLFSGSTVPKQATFSKLNQYWMDQGIKNISPLKSRKTPKVPKEKHSEYCKTVLKQLDGTKEMWATQERKPDGGTPSKFVLDAYFKGGFPICPANGIYDLKTVGEKTQCSEHGSN